MLTVHTKNFRNSLIISAAGLALVLSSCDQRQSIDFEAVKRSIESETDQFDPNYTSQSHWVVTFRYDEGKSIIDRGPESRPGPMPHMGKSGRLKVQAIGLGDKRVVLYEYRVPSPFRRIVEDQQDLIDIDRVRFEVLVPKEVDIGGKLYAVEKVRVVQSGRPSIDTTIDIP